MANSGQIERAANEFARAEKLSPRTDFDRDAQGRAFFETGQMLQKQFDELEFAGADTMEQVLGRKMELAQGIEQQYVGAINAGRAEWAIASLAEATRMYRDMAAFFLKVPLPDGLSPTDRRANEVALQQKSQEYTQKGKETITACAQKAEQLKALTPFAARCIRPNKEVPVVAAKHRRGAVSADDAFQREMAQLRQKLVQTPENMELLIGMARRAIQAGDYHLARLTLAKAAEVDPRNAVVQNSWA